MTATEELCRMLDERGVEYEGGERSLRWRDRYGIMMQAFPLANGELGMEVWSCTPEQAVEATLGARITGDTSDGYHTMAELYHHRAVLFSVIVRDHQELAWKSKLHHDGTMYDGMFIVGIETPKGQATYHYDIDPYWDMFDCKELERAPEWDGHTPDDAIERIATLGSTFERRTQGGIMSIIKRLLCRHEYEFVRNIYGGEIVHAGYNRSWWRCKKCGKWKLDPGLYLELERKEEDA